MHAIFLFSKYVVSHNSCLHDKITEFTQRNRSKIYTSESYCVLLPGWPEMVYTVVKMP